MMAENRTRNIFPWILFAGGILLLLGGLASVMLNQKTQVSFTPTPAAASQVQRVSLEDAKAAFDAKTALFVDVRASSSYEDGHIPGALSIPLDELPSRISELDPKAWIIPY